MLNEKISETIFEKGSLQRRKQHSLTFHRMSIAG